MPEIQAYVGNDDDFFGDFECASSSLPSSNLNPNPQSQEDDEWGDFVESPLQFNSSNTFNSFSFNLFSGFQAPISDPPENPPDSQLTHLASSASLASPGVGAKQWEKSKGAIPLSIFGDEEEEEEEKPSSVDLVLGTQTQDGFSSKSVVGANNGFNLGSGVGFNDLILNLYGQDDRIKGAEGLNSDLGGEDDHEDDFDESCWEFKDASIETGSRNGHSGEGQKTFEFSVFEAKENIVKSESQAAIENGNLVENGLNLNSNYGNINFGENGWGFKDAFSEDGTKEWKVADPSGAETKVPTFDSEIQVGIENGVTSEEGLNINSTDGNISFDENDWEFKDAFSGFGTTDYSSDHKKEWKADDTAGADTKFPTIDGEMQVGIGNGDIMERGLNFNSANVNNFDENGWGVDDAFQETGTIHSSSGRKGISEMFNNQQRTHLLPIFGNDEQDSGDKLPEDGFLHKPTIFVGNGVNGSNSTSIAFSDLISSLYNQAEHTSPAKNVQKPVENGFDSASLDSNSDLVSDDDWDENGWEFKDAFSEARTKDLNSGSEIVTTHKEFAADLKPENFLDFYSRLKEESCFLILRHLDGLKKDKKIAALSGEEAKVMAIDEKIQAANEKLENAVHGKLHLDEQALGNSHVHELIEVIQDPKFQAFELEYNLSKRMQSAEKELSSAVELLEHATSTLHIMKLAVKDEQSTYISTWSKMALACAQELQHGTMIWKQLIEKNSHLHILSERQGLRYFVSLGEIYRVSEVLRASATLYKPWILSNCGDSMSMFVSLEECKSAWMDSGLKEALETISSTVDLEHKGTIKALLESIHVIHELDALALQNLVFDQEEPICRLSLLSTRVSQDLKVVVWNGEHYFLKLANLWANRLSCDPPELAQIRVY
ncbi:hypothetical protein AAC387_Pa03g2329 [Persea americana]